MCSTHVTSSQLSGACFSGFGGVLPYGGVCLIRETRVHFRHRLLGNVRGGKSTSPQGARKGE